MALGDVPGGKGGRCVRLTTYHHIVPMSRNLGALTLVDPSGPAWPVMGVLYLYFILGTFRVPLKFREKKNSNPTAISCVI
jgi:hypothetical protein